jgi:putative ABC transport system permease protein
MTDRDAELREEIESHLKMATADRIGRGEAPAAAAAAARREFGNATQIREATRDVWRRRWLDETAQDVRYALRACRRNPGFALVAILSLALGIGANTALFEVVNAVRLRTLPVADPQSLVEVHIADREGARGNFETWFPSVTQPIWREIARNREPFAGLFAWGLEEFSLSNGGEVRTARGLIVSGEFFGTLGISPAAGRLLSLDDDRPGCAPRAVLGHGLWQRAYRGDPSAIGRTISLNGRPVEIVGVAAAGFHGLEVGRMFDVAVPLCSEPVFTTDGKGRANAGTTWWLGVFGRLKPGWTPERASAQLAAASPGLFRASLPVGYPAASVDTYLKFRLTAREAAGGLSPLRDAYGSPLWLLLAIAGIVLVVACANLANLLLARASAREREMAVRLGLGASRARVVRQLLTESLVLVAVGTILALVLAGWMGQALVAALETTDRQVTLPLGVDWRVLGFASGLAAATCLLFGLAPALRGTRMAAADVMRASARGATASRDSMALRRALVVIQVALSVALLFGSLLFARTLHNAASIDPGFEPDGLLTGQVDFRLVGVPAAARGRYAAEVVDLIRAVPGVRSASTTAIVPITGDSSGNDVWPDGAPDRRFGMSSNTVGAAYFATMEIPLLAGRTFDAREVPESTPVAVVDDLFAATFGGADAALGRRFTREATPGGPEKTFEIVGVVRRSTYASLKADPRPVVYYATTQQPVGSQRPRVVIRTRHADATVVPAITAALATRDPRIHVRYVVMPTIIRDTLVQDRLLASLSGGFGIIAALLTTVGLYGLVAYAVTRRTAEIGIRMALGATRRDIARLLVGETGLLVAIGATCGIGLAVTGGRFAAALLFRVQPYDPVSLAGAVGLLALIALCAGVMPARRATRIEPVTALRAD